jgi:hypothetical protein
VVMGRPITRPSVARGCARRAAAHARVRERCTPGRGAGRPEYAAGQAQEQGDRVVAALAGWARGGVGVEPLSRSGEAGGGVAGGVKAALADKLDEALEERAGPALFPRESHRTVHSPHE